MLLDQGSQAYFITEGAVQLLGLKRTNVNGKVSGLEGHLQIKHVVFADIQLLHERVKIICIRAYVLSTLTSLLHSHEVQTPDWLELENFG